ncbi:low molecular weight phosphatase family protein [Diaminobutyricibacter sp. McL0618]|uniref:arsenate reductase/protein-tyrosine-phosphatase family protein n=1 Tax=Leifsonia sp. McL0618 TaxID=3415677 RepID=UPI003CFAB94D
MSAFRILTVCTGNICRSPLAEQVLRAELDELDVTLSSAGTAALVGDSMDDRAAEYSRQFGGRPDNHAARQLAVGQLGDADLVLALSREHRRAIVELLPRASRFTFTLREFARLLDSLHIDDRDDVVAQPDPYARLTTLVGHAAANRGVAERPDHPADDDVIDPFRQDDAVYAESTRQLIPAVQSISLTMRRAAAGFE